MIEDAMLRWLHNNGTPEAVKVIGYVERDEGRGGCREGTCTWDIVIVDIHYVDDKGEEYFDCYEGGLADFIKELTDAQ